MKSRLGYLAIKDFCFNGFAFKDLLYKNLYAQRLSGVPEFVGGLIECLGCRELGHYFMSNSAYYCYEYRIPIDRVIFDGHNLNSTDLKQRHLIRCVLERLSYYADTDIRNMRDYKNPILRLSDDDILPSNYFVKKERITVDPLSLTKSITRKSHNIDVLCITCCFGLLKHDKNRLNLSLYLINFHWLKYTFK